MVVAYHRHRNIRPMPKTIRQVPTSHPSKGGARGYSMDMREMAIRVQHTGQEHTPTIQNQRVEKKFPSRWTTRRWARRLAQSGHIKPFQMNGNKRSTVLTGRMRFLLVFYRTLFPKCTAAELNCFLYNNTPPEQEQRFYSGSQITRAEDDCGLTRKRGATTARQANLPQNIAKFVQYKYENYPYGVADSNTEDLIDWDECAIFLESADRSYGKVFVGKDLNEEGPYGHSQKYTLTMAVAGNPEGDCWLDFQVKAGTSIHDTVTFLQHILADIPNSNQRTFLCDNLSAHKHHIVRHLIHSNGHRLIYRPPYHPREGPIEYVFNRLQHELTIRLHEINDAVDLQHAVYDIVRNILEFQNYFRHCGL
jgi:transposase